MARGDDDKKRKEGRGASPLTLSVPSSVSRRPSFAFPCPRGALHPLYSTLSTAINLLASPPSSFLRRVTQFASPTMHFHFRRLVSGPGMNNPSSSSPFRHLVCSTASGGRGRKYGFKIAAQGVGRASLIPRGKAHMSGRAARWAKPAAKQDTSLRWWLSILGNRLCIFEMVTSLCGAAMHFLSFFSSLPGLR